MLFDPNQTEFSSEYQRIIWQFGTHIVPLTVSLADVEDEETREGCMQIYDCTMEMLADMYNHPDEYTEHPRRHTGDYLTWLTTGSKPMKKHSDEFSRFLQKIPQFGFEYDQDLNAWSNERYPLFNEYFPRLVSLAKERKGNIDGYLDRRDFRLFAKRITLTLDDLLRPLSNTDRAFALDLHEYALGKGMKVEKRAYGFSYVYKKLGSLSLLNNPFCVRVNYRLHRSGHVHDQFERFLSIAEEQPDADNLVKYIQGGIAVCGRRDCARKASGLCDKWLNIHGARRRASMCHTEISKYRRGSKNLAYTDEDIQMLKRMIDIRIAQIDEYVSGKNTLLPPK